jgi:tetratricopeptide (TPR) repeat protein
MKKRLLVALLLAAVALSYGNVLVNGFVSDDALYITRNAQVVDPSLHGLFAPNSVTNVFRPVTFATFALNWKLGGPKPLGYHLLNLLLHAGATWLLYILLLELLESTPEGNTIALVAALLYAVHPIHTEAVAWAVGRAELLAAGFLFAGWILHLRDRPIASLACFALAMLSKESAVVFLPLVLLGDYAIGKWKPRLRYALEGGLTLLYLGLLWKIQGGRFVQAGIPMVDNPLASLPTGWRILNALRVMWRYVALQIYPATLSSDYSFNQIPIYMDWRHTLPAALAAASAAGVWIWAARKRKAGWTLAGGIYFAGFATTANILVPTGTIMGERLAYLPSAGFCLLLALGWNWLRQRKETLAWGLLATMALAFSVRTVARNQDWKDAFALYSSGVRAAPNSVKMHVNLGDQYESFNLLDPAAKEYQTALGILPDSPEALAAYSGLEYHRGQYEAAGAMMEKALSLSNRNNLDYDLMVVTYAAILIKTHHPDKALENLDREVKESPLYVQAWLARAALHYQQGDLAAARADAHVGLSLNPGDLHVRDVVRRLDASNVPVISH